MPIGKHKDFRALKGALLSRAEKKFKDPESKKRSGPDPASEAPEPRHGNALERAALMRARKR